MIVIDLEAVHTIFQRTISYLKTKPVSERAFNIQTKLQVVKVLFDIFGEFSEFHAGVGDLFNVPRASQKG